MSFTGTFDGNGHSISKLKIDASEDQDHMFGVGMFSCVGRGGVVKNLKVSDIDVKGMMLVGGIIGYAFECSVDNVDITASDPEKIRNAVESTMVMAGGVIGGLTCSECLNCDVEYVDIKAAPGGNCGVLGGGFSKPVLKNCTVRNSSVKGEMGEVPMFGMTQGSWIGGLTGCVNLGEYDPDDWYVEDCIVEDVDIEVSGIGSHVGGLTGSGGVELSDINTDRMRITGCEVKDVSITVGDQISCVGGVIGGGLSEGEPPHSFLIDGCNASGVVITTPAENLEDALTGLLIGQSRYCQLAGADGSILDISERDISVDDINSTVDVVIKAQDGTVHEEAALVGAVLADNGVFSVIAGKTGTTYENFFDVTLAEENYNLWYDCTAAIVGESAAADTVAFMQGYISSNRYGEEAVSYYAENPEETAVFDCFYINGLKLVTFNPDGTITVELEDGTSETHSYDYIGTYLIGKDETMEYMGQEINVEFPCDVYQSTDEAGEFNYFFLRDDTMEETGHIEFRYGKDLEELQGYFTGPYAYWLTAGFDVSADEDTLKSTVELFCLENMDYSTHTEEAISQISDLVGSWIADLSEFGEAYADTELTVTIDENGHGITMMNDEQTADFEAYAYDNGEKGDGKGIYIAYSNLENEAEAAGYTLETDENRETVLTFYAKDGVISYKKVS